jgi:Uma2 family endonuclease
MLSAPRKLSDQSEAESRFVLDGISWTGYTALRKALDGRRIFLSYIDGTLEIMTVSLEHERYKTKFHLLVFCLAQHFGKDVESAGSVTQHRKDLKKGVESDDCYYIASLDRIRGKKRLDLHRDPPPDLSVEVDVTHSSQLRMRIFAAIKIPEVWRFDGRRLEVNVLVNGDYEERDESPTFPGIPIAKLVKFVLLGVAKGELEMVKRFQKWLKKLAVAKKRRPNK